ncbi:MAG: hypothetical protein ACE5R6_11040 [Candidatus Heimdallarchaeota archaeon]
MVDTPARNRDFLSQILVPHDPARFDLGGLVMERRGQDSVQMVGDSDQRALEADFLPRLPIFGLPLVLLQGSAKPLLEGRDLAVRIDPTDLIDLHHGAEGMLGLLAKRHAFFAPAGCGGGPWILFFQPTFSHPLYKLNLLLFGQFRGFEAGEELHVILRPAIIFCNQRPNLRTLEIP